MSTFPTPAGTAHVAVTSSWPSGWTTRLRIVALTGSAKAVADREFAYAVVLFPVAQVHALNAERLLLYASSGMNPSLSSCASASAFAAS